MLRQWMTTAAVCTIACALFAAPNADAQDSNAYFEGFLGQIYYETDTDLDETTYGARGGYQFNDLWGIEGAISYQDIDGAVDVYFLDVSARRTLMGWDGGQLFFIGGPGLFRAEFDFSGFGDFTEDELALHAGLGADFMLGESFYLRPDIRARWIDSDLFEDDIHTELTLGFGWKI